MSSQLSLRISLISAGALTVMAGAAVTGALPAISERFSETPGARVLTQLVVSLPALSIAITSPLAGWLGDSYGKKKVLVISLLVYAAAGIWAAWSPSMAILLICRGLLGAGVAGIATSVNSIVADQFDPEQRTGFIGQQSSATSIAGVFFISTGGWLAGFGWQYPFYLYLLAIPVLLIVLSAVPRQAGFASPPAKRKETFAAPTRIYQYYLIIFIAMVSFYMIPVQMPFLLTKQFRLDSTFSSICISLAVLASGISAWNFKRLQQLLPVPTLLLVATLFNGAAYIVIGVAGHIAVLVIALFASGLGNGLFMPIVLKQVIDLAPVSLRGRYLGGLYSSLFLGQFLSPLIVLPLVHSGLQRAFALAGVFLTVCAFIFFALHRRNSQPTEKVNQG